MPRTLSSRRFESLRFLATPLVLVASLLGLAGCKAEDQAASTASAVATGAASANAPSGVGVGASSAPSATAVAAEPRAVASVEPGEAKATSDAVKARPSAPVGASASAATRPAPSPAKSASPEAPVGVAPPSSSGSASASAAAVVEELPPAAPNSADAVAEKVDAIYLPIQRFSARFEQKYTAKIAGTTKNSEGVCSIKRPGKVSFSYQKPNKNRVVSDGVTLKVYEAENQQMFQRSVASTEYPGALAFILGKGLRHSFVFSFNESAKWEGGPVLVGTPRVPNPGYEKVLFYIDEELLKKGDPACVRRVLVIDAQGNRNRFDFLQVSQPADIPDAEFVFEPPAGTNILQ